MLFNIKIDKTLTSYLASKGIRLEELFVITCFNLNKIDLLKDYLQGRTGDQIIAYLQPLIRKQLLRRITILEDHDWDNYELTELADEVFDDCNTNVFEGNIESFLPDHINTSLGKVGKLTEEEFTSFVTKFLGYFPEGVRNRGGKTIKTNIPDTAKKMRSFLTKYKYTTDIVLKATEMYVSKKRQEGYAWCTAAMYFISKNGVSELASECDAILKGDVTDSHAWDNAM